MKETLLTTIDNPYSPFDQFDEWLLYDKFMHYDTCEYLDRVSHTTDSMSDPEITQVLNAAMDDIVKNDPFGMYLKVTRDDYDPAVGLKSREGGGG